MGELKVLPRRPTTPRRDDDMTLGDILQHLVEAEPEWVSAFELIARKEWQRLQQEPEK